MGAEKGDKQEALKKINRTFWTEFGGINESTAQCCLGFEHHYLGSSHNINIEKPRGTRVGARS